MPENKSKETTTEQYLSRLSKKKLDMLRLKEDEKRYVYLSLHGNPMQKKDAKTALTGIRANIKEARIRIQDGIAECEEAYSQGKILRFWSPSWKIFFSPLSV